MDSVDSTSIVRRKESIQAAPSHTLDNAVKTTSTARAATTVWQKWYAAFKQILPIYIAIHLAFVVTSGLAFLFTMRDFSAQSIPLHQIWDSWHHWDTGHYMWIATHGYTEAWRTAFFPLYPLLESVLMHITGDPFTAGLLISDIACLLMLVVLYQLVLEDFDAERAWRTVLYLSIFPTAFFFAAAYNEALFMCFIVASFYTMRHGRWWWAGFFGLLACLTRSAGLFLCFPFCYEYLRQHDFKLKTLRFDVISGALIPLGLALFAGYCYVRFHDVLAFSHAQAHWQHELHAPWHGMIDSLKAIIISSGLLSFQALRNGLDLGADLFVLALIILSGVGPWRFPRSHWSYICYAAMLFLFLQLFPVAGTGLYPLQSVGRYMLEVFPAFIVLASLGKSRMLHMNYVMISGALLFFLLTQFLTGHWVL